jgi:hypothetical protein
MCCHAKQMSAQRTRYSPLGPWFRHGLGSPRSPRSTAFPPRSPSALPGLRSTASLVLCRCATPHCRACGPYSSSPSPTVPPLTGCGKPQGLSVLAREVSMHAWGLRLRSACDAQAYNARHSIVSGLPDTVGASDFGYFGAHQLQGYPAYMCPCPTLQVRRYRRPRMVGARMVRYSFSCMTLAFTTSRRFIPTLSRQGACATRADADRGFRPCRHGPSAHQ